VEPSTSARSNVAVPVGKSPLTPSSLQSHSAVRIDLAHVSQHPATAYPEKSAETRTTGGLARGFALRAKRARGLLNFPARFVASDLGCESLRPEVSFRRSAPRRQCGGERLGANRAVDVAGCDGLGGLSVGVGNSAHYPCWVWGQVRGGGRDGGVLEALQLFGVHSEFS
jgi:hypothetical protein